MAVSKAQSVRPGDVVEIVFLDHAEHGFAADNGDLEFALYGRVVSTDAYIVTVETWCYANPRTPFDANVVRYSIVRGAIKKLTVLRRTARPLRPRNGSTRINGNGYALHKRRKKPVAGLRRS